MRRATLFICVAQLIAASAALAQSLFFITAASAQGEVSIYGLFCETPEQIDMYIVQQQKGKSAEEAGEEVLKQDKRHTCRPLHVMSRGIQPVGRAYQLLGRTVSVFAVNVVATLPLPPGITYKNPESQSHHIQQLDHPVIMYTPLGLCDGTMCSMGQLPREWFH